MRLLILVSLVALCLAVPSLAQNVAYHDSPGATSTTTNTFPFGNAFGNNWRYQFTVPVSSLPKTPCRFTEVAFAPLMAGTFAVRDFQLRMAHTTSAVLSTIFANNFASTPVEMINVQKGSYTFTVKKVPKWTPLGAQKPFDWDGKRPLVIEIRYRGVGTLNQGTASIRSYVSLLNSNRLWANNTSPTPVPTDPYAAVVGRPGTYGAIKVALQYVTIAVTLSGTPSPGGTVDLNLSSVPDAGKPYQAASSLGNGPIQVGARTLELTPDELVRVTANNLLPGIFVNFSGKLDTNGLAKAQIKIPNDSRLKGVRIYNAFISLDPKSPFGISNISNTVLLSIS